MSTFVVFTYQFSPIINENLSLFDDWLAPLKSMDEKNQIFDEVVNDEQLTISYRNSRFKRRIILNQEHICIFRLANHRYLSLEKDFQPNRIENNPSVMVIVDNREDKQRILIEQRVGAFYDEEYVARILQNSFRLRLSKFKLNITILKEYYTYEFWDLVNSFDKGVEKVRFAFPYPNLSRIKDSLKDVIAKINSSTNSKDTKFELNSAHGETLKIEKNNEFLSGLVEAAAGTGQGIIVKEKGVKKQHTVGNSKKTLCIDEREDQFLEIFFDMVVEELNKL